MATRLGESRGMQWPSLEFAPVAAEHAEMLGRLFERNAEVARIGLFDPFPLDAQRARQIALEPRKDLYFVARTGEIPVAMTMLRGWDEGHDVPSFGILVDEEYRGRGLGRWLTERTLAEAGACGCRRVRLSVYGSNAVARRLYVDLGFVEIEREPRVVAGRSDERIVMIRELTDDANGSAQPAQRWIPVGEPILNGNERRYVLEALDSTWISSTGRFIGEFESAFAAQCGTQHAISVCNGTAALHLALLAVGVGPGDEVLVPSLSYVACANAVTYCGAQPVFIESESQTGNLDPTRLEELITPRTKAILIVHLYGHPVDIPAVRTVARAHGLAIVEDAAEAHGAQHAAEPAGSLGDIATFSFFGNKIITTGEGGIVVTNDERLADIVRLLRGQGQDPARRYWFPVIGFNYRLTNVAAAIGLAQVERFGWHLERRRENARWYAEELSSDPSVRLIEAPVYGQSAFWMNNVVIREGVPLDRDRLIAALADRGVETRPFFYPCHTLPAYAGQAPAGGLPIAEGLGRRGISLPSSAALTREDVRYVCDALAGAIADPRSSS